MLVPPDVTDQKSFDNIKNWMSEIERYASGQVSKIIVGNKIDLEGKRIVPTAAGKAFADTLAIAFRETSAKNSNGVDEVFVDIARDIRDHKAAQPQPQPSPGTNVNIRDEKPKPHKSSKFC
eukprot:TRINITY_DN61_c0_g1_i3.p2 TRINITY_DN61_c0_g1~~TRINITY_DN61_c0_g1_i3.p2  ORF type:complete len:121 (+),score=38.59 TRINITY_DN61_c0_g1_i3:383-745(+)